MAITGPDVLQPEQQVAAFLDYLIQQEPTPQTCWEAWKQIVVIPSFTREIQLGQVIITTVLSRRLAAFYRATEPQPLSDSAKTIARKILEAARKALLNPTMQPDRVGKIEAFLSEMAKVTA